VKNNIGKIIDGKIICNYLVARRQNSGARMKGLYLIPIKPGHAEAAGI